MPPATAAAARCPLLRRAPAALRGALSRSGMARRLVAASAGGGGRAPAYGGLLLDAGGTLLQVARPVAETYASIGRRYGVTKPEKGIMEGFKRAFSAPWPKTLRYQYYAHGDAWCLPDGADTILRELKDAGVKLAVVSNFDTRLRKLLKDLNVSDIS
uniref:Haloacid dehalogenase-like hydrolase domain-containing protein 3 n=1 Tax=Setaria italica TaxID=4555 RepID=K3YK03_SETIT